MLSSGLRKTGPEPTTNKRMKKEKEKEKEKQNLLDRDINILLPRYLFSGVSSPRRETKLIWALQSIWLFSH